jgi:Chitin binding Peritrophin-A domain
MKVIVLLAVFGLAACQRNNFDSRCPQDPWNEQRVLFGHPNDCTVFFRCHQGRALELACPRNTHWSTRSNSCEPVHSAGCMQSIQPPIRPPTNGSPNFLQCPAFDMPGEIVYFAHPQDCQQFYQCSGGRAVQLSCPAGHFWNIQRTFCDQERNVRCVIPRT